MRARAVNWRLVRSAVCLSLPTLAVVALGVRFLVVEVPKIVRDERARVSSETERAAKAMRSDRASADFVWERGKGVVRGAAKCGVYPADMSWKDWRPESGTKRRDMWGGWRVDGGRLVWARGVTKQDSDVIYARVADIDERDYAFMFYVFGVSFLLVLVGITCVGVKCFVDYVNARDDFMAATAHDLTTPLVAMRYMIGRDDESAKTLNERMLRLVGNIKDFMRLGGKRAKPEPRPFDMVKAYEEAYSLFREDFRDAFDGDDVELDLKELGSPRPMALGDETLVVQIFWNLLGNDLKYAAPFGRVRAMFSADGDMVRAELIDEGKGMSEKEMAKAFDRYYRAKTVLESGKGGFGIGLCTAKEFAESMGGSLSVRANSPRGCIFTLALPLSRHSPLPDLSDSQPAP